MADADFYVVYEGGEADGHVLDMRMLALSMLGCERIISDGLIILVSRRLPKRGERAIVVAKAKEPEAGSFGIKILFDVVLGTLPLGLPLAKELAGHFLEEWWKAVISRFTGNSDASAAALNALLQMNRDHLAAREASENMRHEEMMEAMRVIRMGIEAQQRAIEQFVTPIGPVVSQATIRPNLAAPVRVNIGDAQAIRENNKLTRGPLEQLPLRTDGFRFHTNGLSIENPERTGFLMARVRDPKFDEPSNPYTEAAQRQAQIVVLGRRGYKGLELSGIEIVDFIREIPQHIE